MAMISRRVAIPDDEFEITAIRAQGAGGQHINKTLTAIHPRSDIRTSSLPEYYKERLLAANHHLTSSDGVITIKAQEYRNQGLNHEVTLTRLMAVIKDLTTGQKARRSMRSIRVSRERKLAPKAQKSSVKAMRGKVRSGRE